MHDHYFNSSFESSIHFKIVYFRLIKNVYPGSSKVIICPENTFSTSQSKNIRELSSLTSLVRVNISSTGVAPPIWKCLTQELFSFRICCVKITGWKLMILNFQFHEFKHLMPVHVFLFCQLKLSPPIRIF